MRIAIVSHVRQPIAEPFAGGMEAHSWHLAAGLEARGHDVTLFAAGDSDPRFHIDAVLSEHYERTFPWAEHKGLPALVEHVDRGFAAACERLTRDRFDVVHNNSLHRFPLAHARDNRMPTVTSLHVPPFPAIEWFVRQSPAPWHQITLTSRRQLEVWFADIPNDHVSVVPNGIDLRHWPYAQNGGPTGIWCGRIAANKGPHLAAKAAHLAGICLDIFGVVEERDYFESKLQPLLGDAIRYRGHVRGSDLSEALRKAGVLLFTPCWDEPFGLVAVEAMACGLPVAAFDNGAAREVIGEEGGRFAPPGDVAALARAVHEASAIDRNLPRRRAEALYSAETMLDNYEALYRLAISSC